jgi:predicted glycoside hydrolase/deacetylase ChbG (UPF0249 family)
MRVIINADDFGESEEVVRATIECFDNGSLTSATIMVKMPGSGAAIAYARRHPELSFGVHLTYVLGEGSESPVCDPGDVPALVQPDGRFKESNRTRVLAVLRRIPVEQIARETHAQIARLKDQGVSISHVDSHGHLHRYGVFRRALEQVLPRFGITKVRNVQDIYLRRLIRSPNYWLGPMWRRAVMKRFTTTDHFYMPTSAGDTDWCEPLLERVTDGTLEVGVHPGYTEPWRNEERQAVPRFVEAARRRGHELIGWAAL